MEEPKHEEKMEMHGKHDMMHNGPMHPHHHKPWQSNWKSPVALGIFLLTAALALAVLLYTILNIVGAIEEAAHPASSSDAMTQQEMQQLEEQAPASSGAAPAAAQ